MALEAVWATMREVGVFNFYLPFLLTFAVTYGVLHKSKIFGQDKVGRAVNLILALSFGMYVAGYSGLTPVFVNYLTNLLSYSGLVIVTILATILVLAIIPGTMEEGKGFKWGKAMGGAAILIGALLFLSAGGLSIFWPRGIGFPTLIFPAVSGDQLAMLLILAITVLVMYWLFKGEKEGKTAG